MLRDSANELFEPTLVAKAGQNKDIPPDRRAFAKRLKAARIDSGHKDQKDFADEIGIEHERYRRWERGETEPDITHLVKIAKALGRSLDWLILGERNAPHPRRAISA